MARLMVDNGAMPMYYSPEQYAAPAAHQAPYYVIPQPAYAIPAHYSAAPHYVYSAPSSASEYGHSNGAPVFKVVAPSQSHGQYPVHNVLPVDAGKREVTLQETLENALRQQKQPKASQMLQQVPPGFLAPNARHPVYVVPEGAMLGQPVQHFNGYPVYRAEDVGDVNRSHVQFGGQPGGVQFVNDHGIPVSVRGPAVSGSESQPYVLPAAQPGMRWKLVPVSDDREEARGAVPVASPKASSAPVKLLKSPDADSGSDSVSDSAPGGDNAVSALAEDPYKQFLSLLFPNLEDKVQRKDKEDSEARSKVAPAKSTANSVVPEVEVKPASPRSVRVIPVTDTPKEKRAIPVTDAPRNDKRVVLDGEGTLKEKGYSGTDAKTGLLSVKKQPNKPSTPTLKPIRLVPSLDFVKKKESKHVAGLKQEKQANLQKNQEKADSHQAAAENCEREKEVAAEKDVEKVSAAKTLDEADPKIEVAAKRAREKSVEGSSDVESHTAQLEKGDEPSAKKKRLIADSETAARLIQSVYRGYVVRRCQPLKHLRDIACVKLMLREYQALAADRSSLLEKCKDPVERAKISEGIMSLLLQLDVIQGVDPVVREIRKYTSKEVLKLQSEVDAAMALISVFPQVVNKEVEQATPLGMLDDETKSVDKKVATSEEPNSAITNESVERHHGIAARPVEQPEEQVKDLLRKLLNKLPKSGGGEGLEAAEAGEFSNTDDSALISEVVKRLSFLEEQQRNKDTDTGRLNDHEFSADFAHGHVEKQEESTVSDMRSSDNSSDEVLHSISTTNEGPSRSGMADDAASDSIIELTTSSVVSASGGEGSHVAPDVVGEREENKLPISEVVTSPTELELQNLADKAAADFVDEVLSNTEDTLGSVQAMAENKENNLKGQDILDSNDANLPEVSDDVIGLLRESASVDAPTGMAEAPKLVSVESELGGTSHLTPTKIADGETQPEMSLTNSAVIDGEDTTGTLKASEVDNDGERPTVPSANRREDDEEEPQISCTSECAADNQNSDSLMDGSALGSGEIPRQNVTGDDKERTTELAAHEECSCQESIVAGIEAANEEATNSNLVISIAHEEEVQDIDLRDDAARQQFVPTEVACDSCTHATLSVQDEITVNGEAVEVKVEKGNAPEEAPLLSLADCSKALSSVSLWNGLDATCHESINVGSSLQSIAQDSEEVATESARTANASDQSETPENIDVVERMKVQVPNKSFTSQEETIEVDSPTSVLDAVVSMVPAEDVLSDDIAEISLDDASSEQTSIQAVTMEDPDGIKMQQSAECLRNSSVLEEEALQLQSAISDLQSLNNEGEFFLNDESLQLESAISDLHSLNNSGQGFLNDLNPVENCGINSADSIVRCPSLKRITEEVYIPKPPSLSPEVQQVLEGGVSPRDVCERLCPSSASSPSNETELTLTQHLIEENTVLKQLVKDVLKWSQWQSSATLSLHKMMEKLALEVLETKTTAKKAAKCKQGRNKKAAKKKNKL